MDNVANSKKVKSFTLNKEERKVVQAALHFYRRALTSGAADTQRLKQEATSVLEKLTAHDELLETARKERAG